VLNVLGTVRHTAKLLQLRDLRIPLLNTDILHETQLRSLIVAIVVFGGIFAHSVFQN